MVVDLVQRTVQSISPNDSWCMDDRFVIATLDSWGSGHDTEQRFTEAQKN